LRSRAVIANPDRFLTPGMFGSMRLAAGAPRSALLIPDAAVQTDQARKIVLVVERNGTVGVRPVEVGARVGTLRAIRSGLRPTDRVIVEGVQFARPGTPVSTRRGRVAPPTGAAASAQGVPERAYLAPAASQATIAR
jgi:RND family efflux transporter MFP subunit